MNLIFRVSAVLFALFVAGCDLYDRGSSTRYSFFTPYEIDVVMPANAPSISAQFRLGSIWQGGDDHEGDHMGIDVRAATGTRVIAAAPGTVLRSSYEPFYGNSVVIEHRGAGGAVIHTVYRHLQRRDVEEGDRVARGAPVGRMGATGMLAAFPHLHFEVYRPDARGAMKADDPQRYWRDGVGRVSCPDPVRDESTDPTRITYPVPCG